MKNNEEVSKEDRMMALQLYLQPYWCKPSKEIRKFIDDNFKQGLKSCVIYGNREELNQVAVALLLKWGYQDWVNYYSEALLQNAFNISESQLSDQSAKVAIIYNPYGTQRNSFLEEALAHNFSYRDICGLTTVILSEFNIPHVDDVVAKCSCPVLEVSKDAKKRIVKQVEVKAEPTQKVQPSSEDELGPVSSVRVETRGKQKGNLRVGFKADSIIKYTKAWYKDRFCVGETAPSNVDWM